jgi:hypothetical protein
MNTDNNIDDENGSMDEGDGEDYTTASKQLD